VEAKLNKLINRNLLSHFRFRRLINAVLYQRIFGKWILLPIVREGLKTFEKTGRNSRLSYIAMRKLFGNNDPQLFEEILKEVKMTSESNRVNQSYKGLAAEEIDHIVGQLREEGFCQLSESLDEALCLELEMIARTAICELIDSKNETIFGVYDEKNPVAVRYEIPEDLIIQSGAAQRIICDQSLHEIAKQYLECEPVQDLVTMWWSTSINTEASSVAAQQFHFDSDRIKFLKLFVYLTDVDESNGPHIYIPTSHKRLPATLRRDGRHSDMVVKDYYQREMVVTGKRGLVFLADTRGLHKGLPLESGQRLIFQTEYANSLFGYPYKSVKLTNVETAVLTISEINPKFLQRFSIKSL
jgi:ectoine hydroxylase-related dioxygenase (phytanoyl-CoA dioxygenase family)